MNHTISKHGRVWRYSRPVLFGALATLLILVVLRVGATYVLQWYVNKKLDESPMYAGHVGDIDIQLLKGAYEIEDVEINKTEGEVPVPLFAAKEVEFSLLWSALFNGAIVGEAEMYEPQINIVDSKDASKKQTGAGGQWLQIFEDLFPFKIDKFELHNGQIHFRNYDAEPKIDIFLSELEATAENLSNRQALTDSRLAKVQLAGRAMEASDLTVGASFDPTTEKPTFDVNVRLLQLPVLELDNFIRTYAPFDIEAGSADIVSELAARDGQLEGYVKPIVYGLEVFSWKEDIQEDMDNPLRALWEGLVDIVAELLENQPHDQIASNIPLEGDISAPDTNVFVAVAGIFKNAFVEAYQANLENTISLFLDDEDEETTVALPPPLSDEELIDDKGTEEREAASLGSSVAQNDASAAKEKKAEVKEERVDDTKADMKESGEDTNADEKESGEDGKADKQQNRKDDEHEDAESSSAKPR
jgi:hypothetical protein